VSDTPASRFGISLYGGSGGWEGEASVARRHPCAEVNVLTRIAVPLDGSWRDEHALAHAIALTRLGRGALTLVHVHRPPGFDGGREALPQYRFERIADAGARAQRAALLGDRGRIAQLAESIGRTHEIPVRTHLLRGDVVVAVADYANSGEVDLLVMASHGYAGAVRSRLLSVSDAVVRASVAPVLLLRPAVGAAAPDARRIEIRRILVTLDGSAFAETIVTSAAEIANGLGAQVTLLRVVSSARAPEDDALVECAEYLAAIAGRFPRILPEPHVRTVVSDSPAGAILEELQRGAHDLLAMATHGRGGMRHLFVGSVADQVMQGTTSPVLLQRRSAVPSSPHRIVTHESVSPGRVPSARAGGAEAVPGR
jgi:nucleotide-binding universal stress UspA family protein